MNDTVDLNGVEAVMRSICSFRIFGQLDVFIAVGAFKFYNTCFIVFDAFKAVRANLIDVEPSTFS